MKKYLSLFLALAMIFALAACGSSENPDESPSVAPETDTPDENLTESDKLYATHAPDELVMTVSGSPVYWQEFFYWINTAKSEVENYTGAIENWDETSMFNTEMTNSEFVYDYAMSILRQYRSLEKNISDMDIALNDEDKAYVEEIYQGFADSMADGDLEKLENEILPQNHVTADFIKYLNSVERLYNRGFIEIFGDEGAEVTDEEAIEYLDSADLLYAKHILVMTIDQTTNEALPEDELAEKKALAEEILSKLKAEKDNEKKLALFDELMNEHSEDGGLASYPEGYIFTANEMVAEFENGTRELEPGEISEIIESSYGYHIILRREITPDTVISSSNGVDYTLRHTSATALYDSMVTTWMAEAEIITEPKFESFDIGKFFSSMKTLDDAATEGEDGEAEDGTDEDGEAEETPEPEESAAP
ncbi:peptidyl-prolyl cis-trans isomerase [Clostridiaceae bacterium OttesenSCG-928-D20]|nr:peptidyl-prolyl cis-trans isomerase [Clostridiaceae bacterium OttesenSCG-928-D20]